jgi:indole-3-glycerol phosphate synthase
MSILDDIIAYKKTEVDKKKNLTPVSELETKEFFSREVISLKRSLMKPSATGIIAEFKRKSPSKGNININADVTQVTSAYVKGGASGLSVLTDEKFFGGSEADLVQARILEVPILRKDFIIDEYQLVEARAMGADVILLIAAALSAQQVKQLAAFARGIELEVLLEIHSESELEHICDEVDLVGINNRNLKTFEVDVERSLRMAKLLPTEKPAIAESGINSLETINLFRENGFKGFLIGEMFMKEKDPGEAFKNFIDQVTTQKINIQ